MISEKQLEEIREHLEKAQNPIFFFDNDPDGLCSFLLLQRYFEKGKGVPIKAFPEMNDEYFRKITELNADYVFILDKAVVSKSFFDKIEKINLPVVWIDHHEIVKDVPDFVSYYNSYSKEENFGEPVTYVCYKIIKEKKDLWLAVIGCISDKFVPEFYSEFNKKYPELSLEKGDAFDILYNSSVGTLIKLFSFGLKDKTTNVISMLKFLMKAKNPHEVLEKTKDNYQMHKRFEEINSKYLKCLEKAKLIGNEGDKLVFFQYGGTMSMSSELSNELSYIFNDKVIVVAYNKGALVNISVRGKKIREKVLKVLSELKDAHGGGHEDAVGARINSEDLELFQARLEELV